MTLEHLQQPISDESPCGENLDGDELYLALARRINPAHPAYGMLDWTSIEGECTALLEKTRDLNLAMILSLARLRANGFAGWSESLALISAWVENDRIWTGLLPARLGARLLLLGEFVAEYATTGAFVFVKTLYQIPLAETGDPTARTLRAAEDGKYELVRRSIQASSSSFKERMTRPIADCRASFKSLCESLLRRLKPDDEKNRERVIQVQIKMLDQKEGVLSRLEQILKTEAVRGQSGGAAETTGAPATVPSAPASTGTPAASRSWNLTSTEEALKLLEAIAAYYEKKHSSPVPLLVQRALDLASKNFRTLVDELFGKEQVQQLEQIAGPTPLSASQNTARPQPPASAAVTVNSPDEVKAGLDAVCAFYDHEEPSSPVSVLLRRARRLVSADFRAVVADLFGAETLKKLDKLAGEPNAK